MELGDDIKFLKGVGPKRAEQLKKVGISTVGDLAAYYPRAYEDRSVITPIGELVAATDINYTVVGIIMNRRERSFGRRRSVITANISDGTGFLEVTWFNQNYLKEKLAVGTKLLVFGRVGYAYGGNGMLAMTRIISFELLAPDETAARRGILPVYPATEALNQKFFRTAITNLLDKIPAFAPIVPDKLRQRYDLLAHDTALRAIHFPADGDELAAARRTLAFEELYLIQCGLLLLKQDTQQQEKGYRHLLNSALVERVAARLPFALTADQTKAWREIAADMERDIPMRRLLEGDVGSGKTVIALLALAKTVENGYQGALMAPTEILARQHFAKFSELLADTGIRLGLLIGALTPKQHREMTAAIAAHEIDIVIGTHAIIEDGVIFDKLGLAVTDEQHRFGIRQRAALEKKSDRIPDILVMTATPIPRTMTLTVYGDLDISLIEHLPPGRQPIRTFVRQRDRRHLIYKFVRGEIAKGRQAYVVCPLIEESETSDLPSAEEVYAELTAGILRGIPAALLHGRMKPAEKKAVMDDFYKVKTKLLVATTVIEVGVDVPNASIMVIENADRFGLAQLHQLRGRIGRGQYQSYCILVSASRNPTATERLEVMEKTASGFEVAEADLRLRGSGQFFGSMQSGVGDLRIVNIFRDTDILLQARQAALETVENREEAAAVRKVLREKYRDRFTNINDA